MLYINERQYIYINHFFKEQFILKNLRNLKYLKYNSLFQFKIIFNLDDSNI